jgi:LuxR family maltose regulon positive regulatory protein
LSYGIGIDNTTLPHEPSRFINVDEAWLGIHHMAASILLTKLFIPCSPPGIIHRPQLIERLTAGLNAGHILTLLSTPPGYGKTTLLTEWVAFHQGDTAWLGLDEQDNNSKRFWTYFIAALQTLSPKTLGQVATQMLESSQDFDLQTLLISLVNDVGELDHPVIFVLDDYHVISNQAIHEGIIFLLEHLPLTIHLVIVTRADPPLPINRLRGRGQITELRASDLRFTTSEATAFLNNSMKLGLDEFDVQALEKRTEGWIVGLQLAALSMQGDADAHKFIQAFTGNNHYVLGYLADEVLQKQPEPLRNFLLKTSILSSMCTPLCNAVIGRTDSMDVLEELYRSNLFVVPMDREHDWFRYHHLFAELLQSRLQRTYADEVPILHRRAAQWFQENNNPENALSHAFAIPDYSYATEIIVNNWRRIYHQGRLDIAVQWFESLPDAFIRQSPPLGVAYCWTLFVRGNYDRIASYLEGIMQVFEHMVASGMLPKEQPEYNIILHQAILLRAVVHRHGGDVATAINEIEQLLPTIAELRQTLGQVYVDMGLTACYSQLGYAYEAANDLHRAADTLSRVSPHAHGCGNYLALAHATFELVQIYLRLGQIEHAENICRNELSLAEQTGCSDYPAFGLIHLSLADVLRAKTCLAEADDHLRQGLEITKKNGHVLYLAHAYLIAARLHHAQGIGAQTQDDIHRARQIAASIQNRFLDDVVTQTKELIESKLPTAQQLVEPLSKRELEVLKLICLGKSNQEIAEELFIALDTVKRHTNNLYGKLSVTRRVQAIIEAQRLGLV